MAEAELEVLIKAIDEMSGTLKKIEGNLEKTNKNIQKQTEKTSTIFQETTGDLLVLGSAASRVDAIFSSYTNIQLRLENASERVANAQDSLADAQRELNKLQKSGKASADDLRKAEQQVERASRALNIAQNNVARTQNQVLGIWINMGVQSVTLIASLGSVTVAIQRMTASAIAFIVTPLGATLAALGVVIAVVGMEYLRASQRAEKLQDLESQRVSKLNELEFAQRTYNDEIARNKSLLEETFTALRQLVEGPSKEEAEARAEVLRREREVANMREQGFALGVQLSEAELRRAEENLAKIQEEKNLQFKLNEELMLRKGLEEGLFQTQAEITQELITNWGPKWKTAQEDRIMKEEEYIQKLITEIAKLNEIVDLEQRRTGNAFQPFTRSGKTSKGSAFRPFGDFIMRPGQAPVSFSSQDTIVGTKGRSNGNVVIKIENIYGLNERKISEELYNRLRYTLTT